MANAPLGTKDRPYRARVSLLSGEASATIYKGQPVCLSATDAGKVVTVNTGTAGAAHTLFIGIAEKDTTPGNAVEVICGGYVASARFTVRTRAATTDSWSSVASIPQGNYLTIDTANNALASSGTGAALAAGYLLVLASSAASVAGLASSTDNALTVSTASGYKVWIRNLG